MACSWWFMYSIKSHFAMLLLVLVFKQCYFVWLHCLTNVGKKTASMDTHSCADHILIVGKQHTATLLWSFLCNACIHSHSLARSTTHSLHHTTLTNQWSVVLTPFPLASITEDTKEQVSCRAHGLKLSFFATIGHVRIKVVSLWTRTRAQNVKYGCLTICGVNEHI